MILIYKEKDFEKYQAVVKGFTYAKTPSGWDRVQGVQILEDCRIPSVYHGNDYAVIMEKYNGSGRYTIQVME